MIILVILDCVFVIFELLIDLNKVYEAVNLGAHESGLAVFFHIISFTILNIFMIEIGLKIYVYKLEFFKKYFEVFDALVVIIAWCLDIAFLHSQTAAAVLGFKLIVILRLWRVARIISAIIQGIRSRNHAKLSKQKDLQSTLAGEVEQLKTANAKLEEEVTHLRTLARKYGVPDSSIQRYRTTSNNNNNSFDKAEVVSKKADVSVIEMTTESEFL